MYVTQLACYVHSVYTGYYYWTVFIVGGVALQFKVKTLPLCHFYEGNSKHLHVSVYILCTDAAHCDGFVRFHPGLDPVLLALFNQHICQIVDFGHLGAGFWDWTSRVLRSCREHILSHLKSYVQTNRIKLSGIFLLVRLSIHQDKGIFIFCPVFTLKKCFLAKLFQHYNASVLVFWLTCSY